jgi:hypothetical protein
MAVKVLDSWARMAFLQDEPAAEEIEKLLQGAENQTSFNFLENWAKQFLAGL